MAFPVSEQNQAYSALVTAIKNDPVLRREIKTLQTWTGEPPQPPSSGNCPYMRLSPHSASDLKWLTNQDCSEDLVVDLEIVLEGNDVRKMMDAWQSLERAIYPKDPESANTVWTRFFKVGIQSITPTKTSTEVQETSGGLVLSGKGTLLVKRSFQVKS